MKNSMIAVRAKNEALKALREEFEAQMRKQRKEQAAMKKAVMDELAELIENNASQRKPLSAVQVAALTDEEFSWQSIAQLGRWADDNKFFYRPANVSMPTMKRKRVEEIRHFVEVDENGNIIPDSVITKKSTRYGYYID